MTNGKPILCLDFDGVCHSYNSGWRGIDNIPDRPVEGLFEFIYEAQKYFAVNIFSSRSREATGRLAMALWFNTWYGRWVEETKYDGDNLWLELKFPEDKPGAFISLDDRGLLFTGTWPDPEIMREFRPWNKQ